MLKQSDSNAENIENILCQSLISLFFQHFRKNLTKIIPLAKLLKLLIYYFSNFVKCIYIYAHLIKQIKIQNKIQVRTLTIVKLYKFYNFIDILLIVLFIKFLLKNS
jgi:hypothetical protein